MRLTTSLKASALALSLVSTPVLAKSRTPAPTLTPVPTATNSSLDNLTVSQAFPAWQSTVKYELPTAGGAQFFGNYARITTQIRYDAATNSYIVRDTGKASKTSTFAPANVVGAESDATFTVYRKVTGSTTETLRLLNPGAGNPLIALTYVSYGAWRQTTPGTGFQGATQVSDTYFVYGIKTAPADMPRIGTASYNTVIDGTFVNKTGPYTLSGTGNFLANFAAGTISYTATPVGTPASGPVLNFGLVGGSGSIAFGNSSFAGTPNTALNPTYKMGLVGYFFGPAASEIGANFQLSGGGGNGNGVMVGHQ